MSEHKSDKLIPGGKEGVNYYDYSDGREKGDWKTRYRKVARKRICCEALVLFTSLIIGSLSLFALFFFMTEFEICGVASNSSKECQTSVWFYISSIFIAGFLGGTAFSLKWLMHSVAKGYWHFDRQVWRYLISVLGGFYACIVLILMDGTTSDLVNGKMLGNDSYMYSKGEYFKTLAWAFLIGIIADYIGDALKRIAEALFGVTGR